MRSSEAIAEFARANLLLDSGVMQISARRPQPRPPGLDERASRTAADVRVALGRGVGVAEQRRDHLLAGAHHRVARSRGVTRAVRGDAADATLGGGFGVPEVQDLVGQQLVDAARVGEQELPGVVSMNRRGSRLRDKGFMEGWRTSGEHFGRWVDERVEVLKLATR